MAILSAAFACKPTEKERPSAQVKSGAYDYANAAPESNCAVFPRLLDPLIRYLNGFNQEVRQARYVYLDPKTSGIGRKAESAEDIKKEAVLFTEALNKRIQGYIPHIVKHSGKEHMLRAPTASGDASVENLGAFLGYVRSHLEYSIKYTIAQFLVHHTIGEDEPAWKSLNIYYLRNPKNFSGGDLSSHRIGLDDRFNRAMKALGDYQSEVLRKLESTTITAEERDLAELKAQLSSKLRKILIDIFPLELERIAYNAMPIKEAAKVGMKRIELVPFIVGGGGVVFTYVFIAGTIVRRSGLGALHTLKAASTKFGRKMATQRAESYAVWAGRSMAAMGIGATGAASGWTSYDALNAYTTAAFMAAKKGTAFSCELRHYAELASKRRPSVIADGLLTGALFGGGGSIFVMPFKSAILRHIGAWTLTVGANASAALVGGSNVYGFFKKTFEVQKQMHAAQKALNAGDQTTYRNKLVEALKNSRKRALHAQEGILVMALAAHLAAHSTHALRAGIAAVHALFASGVDTVPTAVYSAWDIILESIHGKSQDKGKTTTGGKLTPYQNELIRLSALAHGQALFARELIKSEDLDKKVRQAVTDKATAAFDHLRKHLEKTLSPEEAASVTLAISGLPPSIFETIDPGNFDVPADQIPSRYR